MLDKKRSILNVSVAIFTKVLLLITALLTRRILIQYAGNDMNGLDSLFTSLISFMSVAELGVGTAINFCMYKPIVEGDTKKVAALYNLYKKVYTIIGGVVLVMGLVIMPFLPWLAKGYQNSANLYLSFLLVLAAVELGYVYSCKSSLINAYKNNYITTLFYSITQLLRRGLQIAVLILTRSFELYLAVMILSVIIEGVMVEIYARKHYREIIGTKERIDQATQKDVVKNTKAMFMHKIGNVLVNTIDSVLISAFIGVTILGTYTNYVTIMTSLTGILTLFFTPLTAIIGHLCVGGDQVEEKKYFNFLYFLNFVIGVIFFLGYYAVIDQVVTICFGPGLVMDQSVSLVITLNYFIQFMRQAVLLYRDASGTFYYDRWRALLEGVVNVVLSIVLLHFFGLVGVLAATIITNVLICHTIEPYVLYKYGFQQSPRKYYVLNYALIILFSVALTALHFCLQYISIANVWLSFLVNGLVGVGIALVGLVGLFICSSAFRQCVKTLWGQIKRLFHWQADAD